MGACVRKRRNQDKPSHQVSRPVFLDTGGIDGRQARLRREIDRLTACRDRYALLVKHARQVYAEQQIPLPANYTGWQERISAYETRIKTCWKKYERRNRELAHLASNLLILVALLYDCRLICGENLTTLKTEGRGRGVRGRWRNWRNNTTVRGELWRGVATKQQHFVGMARPATPRDPARTMANTSTMPVGPTQPRYAHLTLTRCWPCFPRLNSESACSDVPNVRSIACFCNGN